MIKPISATDHYKHFKEMEPWDRMVELHYTLRNIPREFIAEYMEIPEERMEQIFSEPPEPPKETA